MWFVSTETVEVIARIFDAEQREQVSGVVGSYEVTRQAIDFAARQALLLLAVISLSLGLINLFPFLPLDGGHIFWSLVEKVRGRPVPFSVMERAGALGFVLVIMLFFIGLSQRHRPAHRRGLRRAVASFARSGTVRDEEESGGSQRRLSATRAAARARSPSTTNLYEAFLATVERLGDDVAIRTDDDSVA